MAWDEPQDLASLKAPGERRAVPMAAAPWVDREVSCCVNTASIEKTGMVTTVTGGPWDSLIQINLEQWLLGLAIRIRENIV